MATGWAGLSMTCYASPRAAAQSSCAGSPGCQGVAEGEGATGFGGSLTFTTQTTTGASSLSVQPCERIDASFFTPLVPLIVGGAVIIICARKIGRLFGNHA